MSVAIIHLSDIHFQTDQNPVFLKTQKLVNQIESTIGNNELVILLITGDIAFSGLACEYEVASTFLNELKQNITKTKNIHFLFVPGNHDCDLSNTKVRDLCIKGITEENDVTREVYDSVTEVQRNFREFAAIFNNEIDYGSFHSEYCISIDNHKFKFNLINTSWISKIIQSPGSILVPFKMLNFSKRESENEVIFTCFHHPFGWINQDKTHEFQKIVDEYSDYIFMGHEHYGDSYSKSRALYRKN